jgi:hypothetical protein
LGYETTFRQGLLRFDETGRIIQLSPERGKVRSGARYPGALVFRRSFGGQYSRLGVNQVGTGLVQIGA